MTEAIAIAQGVAAKVARVERKAVMERVSKLNKEAQTSPTPVHSTPIPPRRSSTATTLAASPPNLGCHDFEPLSLLLTPSMTNGDGDHHGFVTPAALNFTALTQAGNCAADVAEWVLEGLEKRASPKQLAIRRRSSSNLAKYCSERELLHTSNPDPGRAKSTPPAFASRDSKPPLRALRRV